MADSGFLSELFSGLTDGDFSYENCLLAVGFARTKAFYYDLAVELIRHARTHGRKQFGKIEWHVGCYDDTPGQIDSALSLMDLIKEWKAVTVAAGGRKRMIYLSLDTLRCYQEAHLCSDRKAHCYIVITDPRIPGTERACVLPCSHVQCYFTYDPDHPASMMDQFQALSVYRGADWCPFFSTHNIAEAGVIGELMASQK